MFYKVKVEAGAKEDLITRKSSDTFLIKVRPKAQGGQANEMVKYLIGKFLNTEEKKVRIIKGLKTSHKIIEIK